MGYVRTTFACWMAPILLAVVVKPAKVKTVLPFLFGFMFYLHYGRTLNTRQRLWLSTFAVEQNKTPPVGNKVYFRVLVNFLLRIFVCVCVCVFNSIKRRSRSSAALTSKKKNRFS